MENNNKKVAQKRRVTRKPGLDRQEVFRILTEEQNNKLTKLSNFLRSKYRFRLSDAFIVLGIIGFYGGLLALWKNFYHDAMRTTYPFKLKMIFWGMFPYVYERQPKEPFLFQPRESELRDIELYEKYEDNKDDILFHKQQQYEVIVRGAKERMVPALDHREIDTTDFQNLTQMNFDINALNAMKKNINKEMVTKGIIKDNNIYIRERVELNYKASDYKYKDEFYKELLELTKI